MKLRNDTDLDTKSLRELCREAVSWRKAYRKVAEIHAVYSKPGAYPERENTVDAFAIIELAYIRLIIPRSWKVLRGPRVIDLAQTILHEVDHILCPHLEHKHMEPLWNYPVPFAKGRVVHKSRKGN